MEQSQFVNMQVSAIELEIICCAAIKMERK